MTDQGRGRAGGGTEAAEVVEASLEDIQEQRRAAQEDEPDENPVRYRIPPEADEADAVEQFRSAPLDDDDRR